MKKLKGLVICILVLFWINCTQKTYHLVEHSWEFIGLSQNSVPWYSQNHVNEDRMLISFQKLKKRNIYQLKTTPNTLLNGRVLISDTTIKYIDNRMMLLGDNDISGLTSTYRELESYLGYGTYYKIYNDSLKIFVKSYDGEFNFSFIFKKKGS